MGGNYSGVYSGWNIDWISRIEDDMKILMTGCSSGIGATVAKKLIEQGHTVLGIGLGGPELEVDLSTQVGRDKAIGYVVKHKDAECLINNAGITHIAKYENHTYRMFKDVFHVNFSAPYELTQAFVVSRSEDRKVGDTPYRIIHTSSMACVSASRGSVGYVCSKVALEAMSATLAREWAGKMPFMTMCIAPSWVEDTGIGQQVLKEYSKMSGLSEQQTLEYTRNYSPMGRSATHDEVWPLYDFAVNHAPIWMSGEVLRMPGGSGIIG